MLRATKALSWILKPPSLAFPIAQNTGQSMAAAAKPAHPEHGEHEFSVFKRATARFPWALLLAGKKPQVIIHISASALIPQVGKPHTNLYHWSHPPARSLPPARAGSGSGRCAPSAAGRTILRCGRGLSHWCLGASPGTACSCSWTQTEQVRRRCQNTPKNTQNGQHFHINYQQAT